MAKLVKITARKAVRIEGIMLDDNTPAVSVRQMYTTQKAPDVWMPGRNGLVIPLEFAGRVANAIGRTSQEDPDTFTQIGAAKEDSPEDSAKPRDEPARRRSRG